MSDSPIFDQLVSEFAAKGAVYEEFSRFDVPEFVWDPDRPVVQLDKQTKGVRLDKTVALQLPDMIQAPSVAETFDVGLPVIAKKIGTWIDLDVLEASGVEFDESSKKLIDNALSPVSMPSRVDTLSLVVEGLHPTVKPLSERNTA